MSLRSRASVEDTMFDHLAFRVSQGSPMLLALAVAILACAALLFGFI